MDIDGIAMTLSTMIQCPHCGQPYSIGAGEEDRWLGVTHTCQHCERLFLVQAEAGALKTVATGRAPTLEYWPQPAAGRSDGAAIASLVAGIGGFIVPVLPALAAIVLAVIGLRRTGNPDVGGRGYAVAGLALGIVALLLVPAIVVLLLVSVRGKQQAARPVAVTPTWAFYTTDYGETFFVDSYGRSTPFEHEGGEAVMAHVFTCDDELTLFVGYLERNVLAIEDDMWLRELDVQYRKPGPDQSWHDGFSDAGWRILTEVRCPDGSTTNLQPVLP